MKSLFLALAVVACVPGLPVPYVNILDWPNGNNPVSGAGALQPWPAPPGWTVQYATTELRFFWKNAAGYKYYKYDGKNLFSVNAPTAVTVDETGELATFTFQSPAAAQAAINNALAQGYNWVEAQTTVAWINGSNTDFTTSPWTEVRN